MSVSNFVPTSDDSIYAGNASFATARAATTGTLRGGTIGVVQSVLSGIYYIERGFFTFNTADIPDTDTISAATLTLSMKRNVGSSGASYNIYSSTHSDTIVATDFDLAGDTAYCDTAITQAGLGTDYSNQTFTLNAAGIAAISKTGNTKICIREVLSDIANSAPAGEVSALFQTVDSSTDPILSVTHSAVTTNTTNFFNFIN